MKRSYAPGLLLALLLLAGCGARETGQQAYPYPAPATAPPTVYPPPGVQLTPSPFPTVIVTGAVLYAGNVYGIVADAEMRIVHVEPGGGADQGGLRAGDILRSIAGVDVRRGDGTSLEAAREAAAATQPPPPEPGVPVLFVVERDGAPLTLQVAPAPIAPRVTPGQPPATATAVPLSFFYL